MKTKPTKTPKTTTRTPPRSTGDVLDVLDVLGRARRVLWALKLDGKAVDVQAAAAASWAIVLTPEGDGPPAVVRVRRLLKAARRCYGLRCVRAVEVTT